MIPKQPDGSQKEQSIRLVTTDGEKLFDSKFKPHESLTETTTNLEDITHVVNTGPLKRTGTMYFNTTTGRPVWSSGGSAGSVWVDSAGTTLHTPV